MELLHYNQSPWGQRTKRVVTWMYVAQQLGIPLDVSLVIARHLHKMWKPTREQVEKAYEMIPFPDSCNVYEMYNGRDGYRELYANQSGGWTISGIFKVCQQCLRPSYGGGICRVCRKRNIDKIGHDEL